MKKTIPVEVIRGYYESACVARPENYLLNRGNEEQALYVLNCELAGMCSMVSNMLHATGNYKGYGYINRDGKLIGVDDPEFYEYRRLYYR
jgi:hypothetical protein